MNFKKLLCFALSFIIFICCLYTGAIAEESDEKTYSGVIRLGSGTLNVRVAPDTKSEDIGDLINNDVVVIHGGKIKGINADTREWYKIEFQHEKAHEGFAYICADYVINVIEIIPPAEYEPDASFEENLEKQGFPESYKEQLRKLHQTHPNWIFLADHINLTWDEVLAAESAVGKSLVSNSRPASYKSMEYGAYDWKTGSYIGFDGSGWVTAHRDVVAYYLEPRNFLDERGIYQFLDQSYNENLQDIEGVEKIIENSFMANKFPEDTYGSYAELLMAAGKVSKVSPYVLAAMIIQEQGRAGSSGLISGTYNSELAGYYNFFNIGAYASGNLTAVQRGLQYARGDYASSANKTKYDLPWTSRTKSIIGGAMWYGSGYIEVGQDTLYYKKFDLIGPSYYNHQYMSNIEAANSEALLLRDAYADIARTTTLTFSIPVFKDMPEQNKTALPEKDGANNYYLSSLEVDGHSFTPAFDKYTNEYEAVVEYDVTKVKVNATAISGATVSGTGEHKLEEGDNEIVITVTAASGKTAKYKLYIARKEGEGEIIIPDPEITTDLTFGDYLTGIEPETTVEAFKQRITLTNGKLKIYDSKGAEKTSGNICTGDKIKIFKTDDALFMEKNIIVYGDVSGDGKISIIDLANVQKHLLKVKLQEGNYMIAADTNKDGKISIIDLANVQKHILKVKNISQ